jgi:hypothetical protein
LYCLQQLVRGEGVEQSGDKLQPRVPTGTEALVGAFAVVGFEGGSSSAGAFMAVGMVTALSSKASQSA